MDHRRDSRLIDSPDIASFHIAENKHLRANVFPMHYHRVNELFYILDGKGELILEDVRLPIKKSDLILVRPNEDHAFMDRPGELLHLYCVYFSDDALNYRHGDNTLISFLGELGHASRIISTQDSPSFYDIARYFREILFEQNNPSAESHLLMRLLFTEMLIKIKRFIESNRSDRDPAADALSPTERAVLNVVRYVESNYYRNLNLEELAARVPLGTRQFTRIFHKLTGKHVKEYVQELRINEAKRLLSSRQKEIKSVCFEVGFEDLSHFYRVFRKLTGTTPKSYVLGLKAQPQADDLSRPAAP